MNALNDRFALLAGLDILKKGGNAVDATVTTALCEGIYNSMASGVGGGGFLTILSPNSSAEIIDARETAPGAATEGMYKGELIECLQSEGLGLVIARKFHKRFRVVKYTNSPI